MHGMGVCWQEIREKFTIKLCECQTHMPTDTHDVLFAMAHTGGILRTMNKMTLA
jgi:hypothetical protein